jgi:hypothetical protein
MTLKSSNTEQIKGAAPGEMTAEELGKLVDLKNLSVEYGQRQNNSAAALEAARKQIRERGQFVPKMEPPHPVEICF